MIYTHLTDYSGAILLVDLAITNANFDTNFDDRAQNAYGKVENAGLKFIGDIGVWQDRLLPISVIDGFDRIQGLPTERAELIQYVDTLMKRILAGEPTSWKVIEVRFGCGTAKFRIVRREPKSSFICSVVLDKRCDVTKKKLNFMVKDSTNSKTLHNVLLDKKMTKVEFFSLASDYDKESSRQHRITWKPGQPEHQLRSYIKIRNAVPVPGYECCYRFTERKY